MSGKLYLTGVVGLIAAILVGVGEYLLHYDPLARFAEGGFGFMQGISDKRTSIGHFLGVFGATLYAVGMYHIYLMLRPANDRVAFVTFLIATFGFIVGAVWIGSRASVSALIQLQQTPEIVHLIELYEFRYETLLNVTRLTTLVLSIVFVWLVVSGRSNYSRWLAVFNPIALILLSFLIYVLAPQIGKHLMPIALNVAFFIFFSLSLLCVRKVANQGGI